MLNQQKNYNFKLNTGLFSSPDKEFKLGEPISYRDILAWRERQEEWKDLVSSNGTSIRTTVDIQTDLVGEVRIPVEATLKKPQIVYQDSLDFGEVQVGRSVKKDIVIWNPTAETLRLQLFISYDLDESYVGN